MDADRVDCGRMVTVATAAPTAAGTLWPPMPGNTPPVMSNADRMLLSSSAAMTEVESPTGSTVMSPYAGPPCPAAGCCVNRREVPSSAFHTPDTPQYQPAA